jgi:hypothetical protein
MNLNGNAFNWDMLGSSAHVGNLAERLPARKITPLTPEFRNIVARNIIVERSSQFVKVNSIPERPLKNVLLENIDVKSDKLFAAADVDGFVVRNAKINSKDAKFSLIDSRGVRFENVQFTVPGNALDISATNSDDLKFINTTPVVRK